MPIRFAIKRIFIGLLLLIIIGLPTFDLLREKWIISRALAHAKSVRLEHYRNAIDNFGNEQIISSSSLAPEDFHSVGDAFPIFLDLGFPLVTSGCLFNPHHRIIIADASGKVTTIQVCFECDHIGISHGDQHYGDIQGTPFIWMRTLRDFFAKEGMPNSPELYRRSHSVEAETNQAPSASN
jgi:hypothetical protein